MLRKYQRPHRVRFVLYDRSSDSHIYCVLKEQDKEELPERLVLKRWCKNAKEGAYNTENVGDPEQGFRARYGALWANCLSMCF
ncbi:hypothetical protein PIB30_028973 [Stylosanthes scabra]|uniref:Uncharacterized protein n=1 Tax=Stylosanthes scabra TaxID=79078 RepID=A0ABU6VCR1_9FABA|nr:hypothetical protein [Stylosanthes scabra]